MFLGFFMSFALIAASAMKSLRLRREMKARAGAEQAAQSIARRDALTGLSNRRLLLEAMQTAARDATPDQGWAVLLIDLDRFKPVNDIHGHAAGDAVLCAIAERLTAIMPREALVARLGGDEFAILMPHDGRGEELMRLAQQVIGRLCEPVAWEHAKVDIGATIGIALMPQDGTDPESLLRSADIAMYRGKREGRGTFRFFEPRMDDELKARVSLECALRNAIQAGEIRPHYQPLVSLPEQKLLGFEILARWYHPERGIIPPTVFIPIAEDTGLIAELCFSVLRQACLDAIKWPVHLGLAVNISPHQFVDRQLAQRILAILGETGFASERLEVEITESALTNDLDAARETLKTLQNAGVSVALDDFGTGYSSLYHLREMKFDKIKIDRSFVADIADPDTLDIIRAIVGLGKGRGITITAEGVETREQFAQVAAEGCAQVQGYLVSRPIPGGEVTAFLDTFDAASLAA